MKTQDKKDFFEIRCSFENDIIPAFSLKIPTKLFPDYEECFVSEKGACVLNDLVVELSELSEKQKGIFQLSIYDFQSELNSVADIVSLLKRLKNGFLRGGCD